MTYICAPIFVTLPTDNGVTVEFSPSLAPVVPIPSGPQGIPGPQGPQGPQGPAGGVSSVNGKTGDVELDAEDVGALPDTTPLFSGDYDDLTNKPAIPTKVSDLTNDSGFVNAAGAAASAPVQSVNGQTGDVTVSVPTKVSDLTNDSGFVDANGAAAAAPVQSVNGQTGDVTVGTYTSGTDGIWTYRKYSDGTYHAWYVGAVNLLAGTAFAGGYFHQTSASLAPPSFSTAVTSLSGAPNGTMLMAYVGHAADYSTYWFNGAAAAANNYPVRLDMYGTW